MFLKRTTYEYVCIVMCVKLSYLIYLLVPAFTVSTDIANSKCQSEIITVVLISTVNNIYCTIAFQNPMASNQNGANSMTVFLLHTEL